MKAQTERIAAHDRHGCEDGGVIASSGNDDVCAFLECGDQRCFADLCHNMGGSADSGFVKGRARRHVADIAGAVRTQQPLPVDIRRDNRQCAGKTVFDSDFMDDIDAPVEMRTRAGAPALPIRTGCRVPARRQDQAQVTLTAGLLVKDTPAPR